MKKVIKGSLFVLLYLVLIVVSQSLAACIAGVTGAALVSDGLNLAESADVQILIRDAFDWVMGHSAAIAILSDSLLVLLLLLVLRARHISPKARFGRGRLTVRNAIGVLLLLFGLSLLVESLISLPVFSPYMAEHDRLTDSITQGEPLLILFAIGILAPVAEEIAFRGMIYKELRTFAPTWLSVCLSAALFGAMHMNVVQSTYTFIAGVFLAAAYEKTDSIGVPILLHIAFNASNLLPFSLAAMPMWGAVSLSLLLLLFGWRCLRKRLR